MWDKTRLDKRRHDMTRQDKTIQDKTRTEQTRPDKTRQDTTRHDKTKENKRTRPIEGSALWAANTHHPSHYRKTKRQDKINKDNKTN